MQILSDKAIKAINAIKSPNLASKRLAKELREAYESTTQTSEINVTDKCVYDGRKVAGVCWEGGSTNGLY